MFFKRNIPAIADYDKTKLDLLRLGWLSEIYDVESNESIYEITDLGYQYYFAICMKAGRDQLFTGPRLADGQTTAYIHDYIDLIEEGYLVHSIDCKKLTPKAAEYLYVLTDLHGKEITSEGHETKTSKSSAVSKIAKYSSRFMRGLQKVSDAAQKYDKASTTSTRNAWSKDKKSSSRKRTSSFKRKYRYNKRRAKTKKKGKSYTKTDVNPKNLGGFDFKGIGDKMME
tara:strand:- start:785 stop:1465 length:681 start_codon:yes stop_codon:yes gene_type:complete